MNPEENPQQQPTTNTNPQPNTPPPTTPAANNFDTVNNSYRSIKSTIGWVKLVVIGVIVAAVVGYIVYAFIAKPSYEKANLMSMIEEASLSGDPVSLTVEQYQTLLATPVDNPDLEGITTNVQGIAVAFDGETIQAAFSFLPNINTDDDSVYARIDSVQTKDGREVFDPSNSFESDTDLFTALDLEKRSSDDGAYWFGSRDLYGDAFWNLEVDDVAGISGRIIFNLPTNATSITLGAADIGVEKPFAGGFITLEEIDEESVSFNFTGESENLYDFLAYNDAGEQQDSRGYSIGNDSYTIYFDNPATIEIRAADVEAVEYPFTIGTINPSLTYASEEDVNDSGSQQESESVSIETAPTETESAETNTMTSAMDASPVTTQEKQAAIDAYFGFETLLESATIEEFLEYLTILYPEYIEDYRQEFDASEDPEGDFVVMKEILRWTLGYDDGITESVLMSSSTVWDKIDDDFIEAFISMEDEESYLELYLYFLEVDGEWYLDISE